MNENVNAVAYRFVFHHKSYPTWVWIYVMPRIYLNTCN